jgi:NAD(P)-dependent dehydrogenase (short-subunit alcohol dehydrogenase family)
MPPLPADPTCCAIVTGGGRGIGRAIGRRLARDGPVVLVGRDESNLRSACDAIVADGGLAQACAGDVADPETAGRARAAAESRGWWVGRLVCNAGIGRSGPTDQFDPVTWREIFDVNVHGAFYLVRACLPEMARRGRGAVCLISSLAGVKGVPFDAAYTASKHALVGLARSLALEYGKRGVTAVALCPGFVESDMTRRDIARRVRRDGCTVEAAEDKIRKVHPLRRIMSAEEVADVVALVCDGTLASVTGNPLILGGT